MAAEHVTLQLSSPNTARLTKNAVEVSGFQSTVVFALHSYGLRLAQTCKFLLFSAEKVFYCVIKKCGFIKFCNKLAM